MEDKRVIPIPSQDPHTNGGQKKSQSRFKSLLLEGSKADWENVLGEITGDGQLIDTAAEIAVTWPLLDEKQEYSVSTKLVEAGENVHAGNFPFILCKKLVEANVKQGACRVLSEACKQSLKVTRKGVGNSSSLLPVKVFLAECPDALRGLPVESLKGEKRKKTIDALLQAAFVNSGKKTVLRFKPDEQLRFVKSLVEGFKSLDIYDDDSDVPSHITEGLSSWPLTMARDLLEITDFMPRQTRTLLSKIDITKGTVANEEGMGSVAVRNDGVLQGKGPLKMSFKEALALVDNYHDEACEELSKAREEIGRLETIAQEVSQLKSLLEAKTRKIQAVNDTNDKLLSQLKLLEEKHKECKTEVHAGHKEIKALRKQLDKERESHKGITDMLGRKVDAESGSQLRIFKERLASELGGDYQDAKRVASKPMTLERGEMISHSFQELFMKLEALGIDFKGK